MKTVPYILSSNAIDKQGKKTTNGEAPFIADPSTAEALPIDKIHSFSKITATLEPVLRFECP